MSPPLHLIEYSSRYFLMDEVKGGNDVVCWKYLQKWFHLPSSIKALGFTFWIEVSTQRMWQAKNVVIWDGYVYEVNGGRCGREIDSLTCRAWKLLYPLFGDEPIKIWFRIHLQERTP